MNTKTVNDTAVEITGTSGCNLVLVKVKGRDSTAQVNALDLIRPDGAIPPELAEYKFFDPDKPPSQPERQEPSDPVA